MTLPASKWPQLYDSAFATRKAVLGQAFNILITEQIVDDGGASNPQGTNGGTGQLILDFELPAGDPKIPLMQNEMSILINYPAEVGGQTQDVFTIRSVESGTSSGALVFRVHAEARWYELGSDEPITVSPAVTTPTAALTAVLAGSGWTIGAISPSISGGATRSFQITTKATPLAGVRSLPAVFGGEVVFDTVLRKVSLLVQRGAATVGPLYARSNNVADDNRIVDTSQMVTRLYPLGASGLDITTVNAGIGYVENYSWFDAQIPAWPHVIKSAQSTNASLSDPTLLKSWGQAQVAMLGLPRVTYTVNPVLMQTDAIPGLGDVVRVWDKTIALDANARIVSRTLDLMQPWNTKLQINTSAFTLSNALPAGTPTGTIVPVATLDTLAPAAPTGIVVTGLDTIDGNGSHVEYLNFVWNPVTTNSNSSPITDLDHYEVQYRNGTNSWISAGTTAVTAMSSGPMPPGRAFSVQVRACDKSFNSSTWTVFTGTTPGVPVSTLNPPSGASLDVTTFPLTVRATWDGLDNTAVAYPANFDHLEVHISTVTGFTPSAATLTTSMAVGATAPITGRTAGTTYYVKFIAVDTAGFKSSPSAQVSAVPTAVRDGQIESVSISKLLVGSLTADLTVAARIKTADTGARVELSSAGLLAYNASSVNTLNINSADGSVTAVGGTFTGALLRTAASGKRWEIGSVPTNVIDAYTGHSANDPYPGTLTIDADIYGHGHVFLKAPGTAAGVGGGLEMYSPDPMSGNAWSYASLAGSNGFVGVSGSSGIDWTPQGPIGGPATSIHGSSYFDSGAEVSIPGKIRGQPYTVSGSTVGVPGAGGQMILPYGVTFTSSILFPIVCSGAGALIVLGSNRDASTGNAYVYSLTGVAITTGSRRVNWTVTGILA